MASLRKITDGARAEPRGGAERPTTLDEDALVPLASAYHAGEIIADKYRLVKLLGEGGMGAVWLAHNVALDSEVAIKLLRAGEKSVHHEQRLLKEARATARLGHPAIVRVFDFGVTRIGDPYLVMELLDGEDLSQTLSRRGRLTPIKAVRTLLPVLHALGTAHQKGIVHRDLKPENIFLTNNDSGHVQPKLVDFGIVKTGQPDMDRLTRVGTVLGTPAYLCPEQARGEDVDHRADIWSAAVVLYEMVTGRLPFEGLNYNALMRSIIEDVPPPTMSFASGDPALWSIVEKGLAKRALDRWQSMDAFGGALAGWLIERGETDDISGASLRAAWQQKPGAAQHDELYSMNPREVRAQVRNAPDPARTLRPNEVEAASPRAKKRLWALGGIVLALALTLATWAAFRAPSNLSNASPGPAANAQPLQASAAPSRPAEPAAAPGPASSAPKATPVDSASPETHRVGKRTPPDRTPKLPASMARTPSIVPALKQPPPVPSDDGLKTTL